jgi:hypothetical protein
MIRIGFGIFMVLHGLVHLLYMGHSARVFELQPGLSWPDGSLAFSRLLGDGTTRTLAGVLLAIAAIAFLASGAGVLAKQAWWRVAVVGAAAFSAVIYLLLWDGGLQKLADKGGVGLLINVAILVAVLALRWPALAF